MKSDWIKGGDENTSYFHACLRKRRMQNHISRIIKDINGVWQDSPEQIEEALVWYYKMLLGTQEERKAKVSMSIVNEGPISYS